MKKIRKNKIIFILIIIALFVGSGYFLLNIQNKQNVSERESIDTESTSNTYTNNEYGFSFTYPDKWRMEDSGIDYGTLQFFNYPKPQTKGGIGINKIEASVSENNTYGTSSDYPEEKRVTTEIIIAEQESIRIEIKLISGDNILYYSIPLSKHPGKFFSVAMYGDPLNFYILDELVESFEWIQ